MFSLEDRVVVVTGGTGLIGSALVKAFAGAGARVLIASRNANKAGELQRWAEDSGHHLSHVELDLSQADEIARTVGQITDAQGHLDVWVNNAWPRHGDWLANVEQASCDDIRRDVSDHLVGYFECARQACQAMRTQGNGSVINMGSIYGLVAPRFSVYDDLELTCPPAYPLIKGGVVTMTRYLASYFARHGVRVNCLCPGGVFDNQPQPFVERYERLTPVGRMARADDIVGPAVFLASDASRYVTGQVLAVDGGWTAM